MMASKLSMDVAYRADFAAERELRDVARDLETLSKRRRMEGTTLARRCVALAGDLRAEADHIVRVWD